MQVRTQVRADLRNFGDVHADALAGILLGSGYSEFDRVDCQAVANVVPILQNLSINNLR